MLHIRQQRLVFLNDLVECTQNNVAIYSTINSVSFGILYLHDCKIGIVQRIALRLRRENDRIDEKGQKKIT